MKKETKNLNYQHPEMKVIPVAPRNVLCASGLQDYEKGDDIVFIEPEE